jgi:hypothetical protein
MKRLVVYSSRTGNTRKLAEAIAAAIDADDVMPVASAPDPSGYDFVAMGFWADKGGPDELAQTYMKRIAGKAVGLFGTAGVYPESEHGIRFMARAVEMMRSNDIRCTFHCQGRIDPVLVARRLQRGADDPHGPATPEWLERVEEAAKHPNADDLALAARIFRDAVQTLGLPCVDSNPR